MSKESALKAYYNMKADPDRLKEHKERKKLYDSKRQEYPAQVPDEIEDSHYIQPFNKRQRRDIQSPNALPWATVNRLMAGK